ncbi:MAG: steroid 5-alpha reductase family enzyme [Zhongshania sp.]
MKKIVICLALIVFCVAIATGLAYAGGDGGLLVGVYPALLICAAIAFAVQWLAFIPAYLFQTEHYYDLTGSATYVIIILLALYLGGSEQASGLDGRSVLLAALVVIWAARLGPFLFRRVKQAGKDGRFDEIKVSWPRFLLTWTLQGLWVFVTLVAALTAMTSQHTQPLGFMALLGGLVWLLGFGLEVVADGQKSAFNKQTENAGKFINVGLWRWSRHPNYFGEIVLWLGIALIALPVFQGWQWLSLISPVFVTLLLTRISGVPLLEKRADKKWGGNADYESYKRETSVLIPRPPKNGL